MRFFAPFCIPFIIGTAFLFAALAVKWGSWLYHLPRADKKLIGRNFFTLATPKAIWEVIRESLLHARIWRVNSLLGYMHTSLAFGWFLLILVGWIETTAYVGLRWVPLQGHVFFKYFAASAHLGHKPVFDFLMDLLLLFVLSGVAWAVAKRIVHRFMGMRRTTRHIVWDKLALSVLWFIFPIRLIAESITCAVHGGGGFLTGSIGTWLAGWVPRSTLYALYEPAWWVYSICLGLFFIAMPFSRYMHIFTEIPLIFLRQYKLRSGKKITSYDNFQVEACSRCGICIDPCQIQTDLGVNDIQSTYFLRDRRYHRLELSVLNNCFMCGRCEQVCPVGINLNTLRQNSRDKMRNVPNEKRYEYFTSVPVEKNSAQSKIGYFTGCMTHLTPGMKQAMERIFTATGESVWWADREGGVCCGRPLLLSGETDSARKMIDFNTRLIRESGITTLVTSCAICLKVFRDEYHLTGVELLHHSEYIERLLVKGSLKPARANDESFTYHDPCELGRGCGIYDAPRAVIASVGVLVEPEQTREMSLCCGSSLANTVIDDGQQLRVSRSAVDTLTATGAKTIVTACPLCKKALARGTSHNIRVKDLAEIVAERL